MTCEAINVCARVLAGIHVFAITCFFDEHAANGVGHVRLTQWIPYKHYHKTETGVCVGGMPDVYAFMQR